MYSESEDFRSIWALAHDWGDVTLNKVDSHELPKPVLLNIQRISAAIINRSLKAQTRRAIIFVDDSIFSIVTDLKHFRKLLKCKWGSNFDKDYLQTIYVKRSHFIDWCELEKYPKPDFWLLTHLGINPQVTNRPKNEAEDKAVCRAIAKVYWDIDPSIHPSHMIKSRAIRIIGNGNQYKDNKTIKAWIADIDPDKNRKPGRPEEIVYKIDLETGGLHKTDEK